MEPYNRKGLQGLNDRRGGNRRTTLTAEQKAELCERLDRGATPENGVCALRGVDAQHILAQEFNLWRRLSSIYSSLPRLSEGKRDADLMGFLA